MCTSKLLIAAFVLAPLAAVASPGAYVGLNLGYGTMNMPELNTNIKDFNHVNVLTNNKKNTSVARIDFGYLFGQGALNYGFEMGISKYGNNETSKTISPDIMPIPAEYGGEKLTYSGYDVDLLGVIQYNITQSFNVFGKAGVSYATQKTTLEYYADDGKTVDRTSESKSTHKILPEAVIGIGYEFSSGVGLNVSYSHIFGSKSNSFEMFDSIDSVDNVASVDMITVGIKYTF